MRVIQDRMRYVIMVLLSLVWVTPLLGLDTVTLTGRILDKNGDPVQGGEVYVFDSPRVKRPADFISPRTGADGRFTLTLPVGSYWGMAVLRKSGKRFGPLTIGDKHSGEAVRIDLTVNAPQSLDFVVLGLREASMQQSRKHADMVKISGRIVDQDGKPVSSAYAAADKRDQPEMPEYLSAWTDDQGRYSLYLPRGSFHMGAARTFPPGPGFSLAQEYVVTQDTAGVNIVIREENRP